MQIHHYPIIAAIILEELKHECCSYCKIRDRVDYICNNLITAITVAHWILLQGWLIHFNDQTLTHLLCPAQVRTGIERLNEREEKWEKSITVG